MKIHVWTQDSENYGSAEQPYWKMKGGEDFFIPVSTNSFSQPEILKIIEQVRPQIELNHEYARSFIIGWDLVEDDYITEFEQNQLEFDGRIIYATKIINIA